MLMAVPTLGERIRALRERPGIGKSQIALASEIGVSSQQLSDWENDRPKTIELANVFKLAIGLGVSVEELVEGVSAEYQQSLDLIRQTRVQESGLPQGGGTPNGPIDARVLERLTTELRDEEKALSEVRKLVAELGAVATRRSESLAIALKETVRSRRR